MTGFKRSVVLAAGSLVLALYAIPSVACETDADCGAGYVCESYEIIPPCDVAIDCAEGDEECLARIKDSAYECDPGEPYVSSYCRRANCETDADCGPEMVCMEFVEEWCSGSDGDMCDGEDCMILEETECGSNTIHECGYRYEGSCEVDADCGPGFNCVDLEICSCRTDMDENPVANDGDPGIAQDDEDGGVPPDMDCGCEVTGDRYCQLQDIPCAEDADCPDGFHCYTSPGDTICYDCDNGDVDCWTNDPISQCQPDGWDDPGGNDGDIDVVPDTDVGEDSDVVEQPDDPDDDGWFGRHHHHWQFWGCAVSSPAKGNASHTNLMDLVALFI